MRWVARGSAQKADFGFAETNYALTLEVAAGERLQPFTLEIGGFSPTRRPYAAVHIEGEPVVFELSPSLHESLAIYLTVPQPAAK